MTVVAVEKFRLPALGSRSSSIPMAARAREEELKVARETQWAWKEWNSGRPGDGGCVEHVVEEANGE